MSRTRLIEVDGMYYETNPLEFPDGSGDTVSVKEIVSKNVQIAIEETFGQLSHIISLDQDAQQLMRGLQQYGHTPEKVLEELDTLRNENWKLRKEHDEYKQKMIQFRHLFPLVQQIAKSAQERGDQGTVNLINDYLTGAIST